MGLGLPSPRHKGYLWAALLWGYFGIRDEMPCNCQLSPGEGEVPWVIHCGTSSRISLLCAEFRGQFLGSCC